MITSTSNPKIKNLMQLQKKGKARREQQCFVVEGIKMVLEAPDDQFDAVLAEAKTLIKQIEPDVTVKA